MTKSYENIRAYVTSKVDGYKYLTDEDVTVYGATNQGRIDQSNGTSSISVVNASTQNPFTVGAEAQLHARQEALVAHLPRQPQQLDVHHGQHAYQLEFGHRLV